MKTQKTIRIWAGKNHLKPIDRNRVSKLELKQTKNGLFWKGLWHLKGCFLAGAEQLICRTPYEPLFSVSIKSCNPG